MSLDILDAEELFHVSLSAMQNGRDGEALEALKRLLALQPGHLQAQHLLGAQYAQLGMFARAEAIWRALLVAAPEFDAARFQLGRLVMLGGDAGAVQAVLAPLIDRTDDLGWYAQAVVAASRNEPGGVEQALANGLACEQSNPGVTGDMRQWLQRLREQGGQPAAPSPNAPPAPEAASMLLSGYGRH
jgi:predicted Zn-dependent protease